MASPSCKARTNYAVEMTPTMGLGGWICNLTRTPSPFVQVFNPSCKRHQASCRRLHKTEIYHHEPNPPLVESSSSS